MSADSEEVFELREQVERLGLLVRVGVALSAERNTQRLMEMILLEAKKLCAADGGTLYLRTENDHLRFAIMVNDSLGVRMGGTSGVEIDLPEIPIWDPVSGRPNRRNVATHAASLKESVNVPDAYDATGFDFSGTKAFDARNRYISKSFLTIPMVNGEQRVIGVLQLINALGDDGKPVPFPEDHQRIVEALASQAAVALDNQLLAEGQKALLESFIRMIASSIDAKSPYTGAHCERVPVLTEMLTRAICESGVEPFENFDLTEDEWYELRIASWLHDCGKVTTPVHVMDKATKLETICDRIHAVRARVEILVRDAEIKFHRQTARGESENDARAEYEARIEQLRDDLKFLERTNVGGEFLDKDSVERVRRIAKESLTLGGERCALLSEDEVNNLSVQRGTLTSEERLVINKHMVQTVRMLEALPFPRTLRRVPEYASGHHERMDGTGYPRGIFAGDMSIPARVMAIADVFEALTAQDRPYKKGKKLSEAMNIMGRMKERNHLDPHIFDIFVQSGTYRRYAKQYLPSELIDDVDDARLLAIRPRAFELPEQGIRAARWTEFLKEYQT